MFKNSMKQFLRSPGKSVIFFLLMLLCTLMVTVSAAMLYSTGQQIAVVEESFTTIGMVEQAPVGTQLRKGHNDCVGSYVNSYEVYEELYTDNILDFEGANYIYPPRNRPYYISYRVNWSGLNVREDGERVYYVLEFACLEDSIGGRCRAKVYSSYVIDLSGQADQLYLTESGPKAGDEIILCQHNTENIVPMKKGRYYVAAAEQYDCPGHGVQEYAAVQAMYSTQCNLDGQPVDGNVQSFPTLVTSDELLLKRADVLSRNQTDYLKKIPIVEEIFPDSDGNYPLPSRWSRWVAAQRNIGARFPVLGTDALELLPTYHSGNVVITQGRAITQEEFDSGAKVCIIPQSMTRTIGHAWEPMVIGIDRQVGQKCLISLECCLFGYAGLGDVWHDAYSFLDSDGEVYTAYAEDEYEVVGTYKVTGGNKGEMLENMLIIPAKSVPEKPENIAYMAPMTAMNTSFMIPNGTIDEFDEKLHEAVPEAEHMTITYDDGGYTEVMGKLNAARRTALLLLGVSLLAELSVTALALYFFVAREKRRTAIERSLGLTKRQCRASILAALMVLTVLASGLGCLGGLALTALEPEESHQAGVEEDGYSFSRAFSLWAMQQYKSAVPEAETRPPAALYAAAFVWQLLLIFCGSLLLVNRNMKIEPLVLLGQKG